MKKLKLRYKLPRYHFLTEIISPEHLYKEEILLKSLSDVHITVNYKKYHGCDIGKALETNNVCEGSCSLEPKPRHIAIVHACSCIKPGILKNGQFTSFPELLPNYQSYCDGKYLIEKYNEIYQEEIISPPIHYSGAMVTLSLPEHPSNFLVKNTPAGLLSAAEEIRQLKRMFRQNGDRQVLIQIHTLILQVRNLIKDQLRQQKKLVKRIRKLIHYHFTPDIRTTFRRIIRMLFKNLSDLSGCADDAFTKDRFSKSHFRTNKQPFKWQVKSNFLKQWMPFWLIQNINYPILPAKN